MSIKPYPVRIEQILQECFAEMGESATLIEQPETSPVDLKITLESTGQTYCFSVKARERITPQMADALCERFLGEQLPAETIRLVYSLIISPRVAEIARHHGVSFLDYAGNCHIADRAKGLLISRSGIKNKVAIRNQSIVNIFSSKSSRIVRVMLHEPTRGWQVSELAKHPNVKVSAGLTSKVKQALIKQSYAVVRDRLLYLKQPRELLTDWARNYIGPASERQFYGRGELSAIEERITKWCQKTANEYSLARFSAAWRLAPEVHYLVASMYLGKLLDRPQEFDRFCKECGLKEVDSGGNLVLLSPYDKSVFMRITGKPATTSPLQTYLDLQSMAGRGEEAAEAVYEKHLRATLELSRES